MLHCRTRKVIEMTRKVNEFFDIINFSKVYTSS
jgi:hypothetical protein